MSIAPPVSRNDPCPCGSGRRYKHCHGASEGVQTAAPLIESMMQAALAAQLDGKLDDAALRYRAVLAQAPDQADCLHMLGVIDYLKNDICAAIDRIARANVLTDWQVPMMRSNLALAVGRSLGQGAQSKATIAHQVQLAAARHATTQHRANASSLLVSIVIPSYNHARYIETALASVFAQTYPQLELIVIDDGSKDDSPAIVRRVMAACPFPNRVLLRGNQGAAATINEGVALARGTYINVLNSDDAFEPERINECVQNIHHAGADWGFTGCTVIDEHGARVPDDAAMAHSVSASMATTSSVTVLSDAFFRANPSISTGNLFISKALLTDLGGFSDLRYNHDWEFCLNASWRSEPVRIARPLYRYRLHGRNTILESAAAARAEADALIVRALQRAESAASAENPLALCLSNDASRFWSAAMAHSMIFAVSADTLRYYANRLQKQP